MVHESPNEKYFSLHHLLLPLSCSYFQFSRNTGRITNHLAFFPTNLICECAKVSLKKSERSEKKNIETKNEIRKNVHLSVRKLMINGIQDEFWCLFEIL